MGDNNQHQHSQNRIFAALTLPRLSTATGSLLTSLLLIEISKTFGTTLGVTNQIKTANSVLAIIAALLMGIISIRYNHKSLLLLGISLGVLSTLGCIVAPSFLTLAIAYSSGGLASGIIFPMSTSLLGEYIIPKNRSKILGWMIASMAVLYLVGPPIMNYIGDWRQAYLYFALPLVVLSMVFCYFILPASAPKSENGDMWAGIKGVFSNKSAVTSLAAYGLSMGVWSLVISLFASFYRQQINLSLDTVTIVTSGLSLFYMVGALLASKVISRFGSKRTVYTSLFLVGIGTMVLFFLPDFYVNLVLLLTMSLIAGIMVASCQNLSLEQLPDLRGPMMSMQSVFSNIGAASSLGFSGYLLIEYGWGTMGAIVGVFGLVASFLVYSFVHD